MTNLIKREALAEKYRRLLKPLALKVLATLPPSIELNDLMQSGEMALWMATANYDERRSETWEFYIRMRIRGAMIDSVKGREYREAMHQEMPEMPVADPTPTIEQTMIAREEVQVAVRGRLLQMKRVDCAIADQDRKFYPLSRKQKKVIVLRFGGEGMKQRAAGATMGVSQQAAQQLEAAAIGNLRKKLAAQ